MKYQTMIRGKNENIIKEFDSLEDLNNYYGFRYKETDKFPDIKFNVMGLFDNMIIDRI